MNREQWIKDAEDVEKSASVHTCQAIVSVSAFLSCNISSGVEVLR